MSDTRQSRVFWLALPPLKLAARHAAARVALRSRIANPHASTFAVSTSPRADGMWCALVVPKAGATTLAELPEAARVPWQAETVTWAAHAAPPFAISARGESVAFDLDAGDDGLPSAVLQLVAQGARGLTVIGAPDTFDAAAAQAQLGVPISLVSVTEAQSQQHAAPSLAFSPLQNFDDAARSAGSSVGTLAASVAALAGVVHFGFAAWQFAVQRAALKQTESAIATLADTGGKSAANWRTAVRTSAPWAARDSASSLLEASVPAVAATAERVKSVQYENGALLVEWSALNDAERAAFAERIAASDVIAGVGVVASGTRARVVVADVLP